MRTLCLLLLSTLAVSAQPFSFGVKTGLPLTDFVKAAQSQNFNSASTTNRYLLGVTGEARLPFGLGVELDVIYRHFNFRSVNLANAAVTSTTTASSGAWEIPLLAKYRFKGKLARPFVDGGVAWDRLGGLTQTVTKVASGANVGTALNQSTTHGYVIGGGLDLKVAILHVLPEVRFTRWGAKHFIDPSGLLDSKQTQAEFLLGISF
jgi:hypothetical protein